MDFFSAPDAHRQAHTGHDPQAGRRRQALDRQAFLHDRTGAEKADAADDLRRQAGRIGVGQALHPGI